MSGSCCVPFDRGKQGSALSFEGSTGVYRSATEVRGAGNLDVSPVASRSTKLRRIPSGIFSTGVFVRRGQGREFNDIEDMPSSESTTAELIGVVTVFLKSLCLLQCLHMT